MPKRDPRAEEEEEKEEEGRNLISAYTHRTCNNHEIDSSRSIDLRPVHTRNTFWNTDCDARSPRAGGSKRGEQARSERRGHDGAGRSVKHRGLRGHAGFETRVSRPGNDRRIRSQVRLRTVIYRPALPRPPTFRKCFQFRLKPFGNSSDPRCRD